MQSDYKVFDYNSWEILKHIDLNNKRIISFNEDFHYIGLKTKYIKTHISIYKFNDIEIILQKNKKLISKFPKFYFYNLEVKILLYLFSLKIR